MIDDDKRTTTSELATSYITRLTETHRQSQSPSSSSPAFILLQGPQGIGKTTLTRTIQSELSKPPHPLHIVILSLDDFYLPHAELLKRAEEHSNNALLEGRGQPGTHDLELMTEVLGRLSEGVDTEIPIFDKSLNGGAGDRSRKVVKVVGKVDVVILEGWCVGFYPLSEGDLVARYHLLSGEEAVGEETEKEPQTKLAKTVLRRHRLEDLRTVNGFLKVYAETIYPLFTGCIELSPPPDRPYSLIYKWRLGQEHQMKASNGGRGMSDTQVTMFINRYIPGYVFFREGIRLGWRLDEEAEPSKNTERKGSPPWKGRSVRIVLDEERRVVEHNEF